MYSYYRGTDVYPPSLYSYVDEIRSRIDPRLLSSAAYKFPDKYELRPFKSLRHRFKPHVKAREILAQVNLSGKIAIVTGANSGLGQSSTRGRGGEERGREQWCHGNESL